MVNDSKFYLSDIADGKYDFKEIKRENLAILYDNLGDCYTIIDEIRGETYQKAFFK